MSGRLLSYLAAFALVFYILFSVLLGGGNVIGEVASFIALGSAVLGVMRPRVAMYYLVVLAAYSDLLKRLMILDGRFGMMDIMWVRGLCPMTLGGIFIGVMASCVQDGTLFRKRQLATLILCSVGFIMSGLSALRAGGTMAAATQLADGASYLFLLVIVPCLFRTPGEIIRFVKYLLVVFIPVALYGLKQQFMGLSDFEIEYLKSGFTILSKHLEDSRPRPFSTLTDSSPFGTACAVCACLALMVRSHYRRVGVSNWNVIGVLFWIIFVAGCVASLTRFANVNWLLPLLLLPLFGRARTTLTLYAGTVLSFAAACVYAKPLKDVVTRATVWAMDAFGGSALGEQFARFWTLGARLDGMYELAHNGKMWTMFGYGPKMAEQMKSSGDVASHDMISGLLLEIGWLPMIGVILIAIVCLRSVHGSVLSLRGTPVFPMCVWMLATVFGLLVHDVFAGNVTATFPVNFFFWFIAGSLNSCVGWHELRQEKARGSARNTVSDPRPEAEGVGTAPMTPRRAIA
jgi:hypothetical protein